MNFSSKVFLFLLSIVCIDNSGLNALTVGSRTAVSVQPQITFPSAAENIMLGFAAFNQGFILTDASTTCTFDDYFPVAGQVKLNGGSLVLKQDLTFSNTLEFYGGGTILAQGHTVEFPTSVSNFTFPTGSSVIVGSDVYIPMGNNPVSVDWKLGDSYVAASSQAAGGDNELKVGYYDGSSVTTTISIEHGRNVNTVRWSPNGTYLAVGRNLNLILPDNEVLIYQHTISNGTFTNISSGELLGNCTALAWHPSGNFILAGYNPVGLASALVTYPVTNGVLGLVSPSTAIALLQTISTNAMSFSPGGNQVVIGTTTTGILGSSELRVYDYTSALLGLTLTTSFYFNDAVQAVDWSPTGSYIAVGLTANSNNLRIFDASVTPMREVIAAREALSEDTFGVHWDRSGTYLLVASQGASSGTVYVYKFDKIAGTLNLEFSRALADQAFSVRWNHQNNHFAYGYHQGVGDYRVAIDEIQAASLGAIVFGDAGISLNSDLSLIAPLQLKGTCKIDGNGKRLNFSQLGEIVVRGNGSLILENIEITNLTQSKLRCMTDSGSIIIRNSILHLDNYYTFSRGSIKFDSDSVITGSGNFFYTSCVTSTIASQSTLMLSDDATFYYAPECPLKNLLYFEDNSATLYLDGCSIISTRTGLLLTGGTLIVDNHVTLSSQALNLAEALVLDSSLDIRVQGGSMLDLYGCIRYEP